MIPENEALNKIIFTTEDNEQIELYIEEQTILNGHVYLLASKDDDDESEAYILKDISTKDDIDAVYSIVDDEDELSVIADIFKELLEDVDILL